MFAEFKKIPADQFAYADLDFTDDLKRDFPGMKPGDIGLFNIFSDK